MNAQGAASPLVCVTVALASAACAFGQVVCAASEPKPDRNPTAAGAIGPAGARLSGTETDHAVVARDPQPSIQGA